MPALTLCAGSSSEDRPAFAAQPTPSPSPSHTTLFIGHTGGLTVRMIYLLFTTSRKYLKKLLPLSQNVWCRTTFLAGQHLWSRCTVRYDRIQNIPQDMWTIWIYMLAHFISRLNHSIYCTYLATALIWFV